MRIDEFEFRNQKGQEIEPTKAQLVIYIKSLHKDIKDLEAKLAESENKVKKAYQEGLLQKQFDKDMEIEQLKQQLAESEENIKILEEDRIIMNKTMELYVNKCENYEQQLAEAEEEIKKLNNRILVSQLQAPKEQILNILGSQCIQYNPEQDKLSFALEQLEKVKEILLENLYELYSKPSEIWDKYGDLYDVVVEGAVNGTIDNQIKQLKEGK